MNTEHTSDTEATLRDLAGAFSGPLTYHAPTGPHEHWAVLDAEGQELFCPHTPPPAELMAFLLNAHQHYTAPTIEPSTKPATADVESTETDTDPTRSAPSSSGVPTPADLAAEMTPPRLEPGFTDGAYQWLLHNRIPLETILAVLEEPDEQVVEDNVVRAYGRGYEVMIDVRRNRVFMIQEQTRFGISPASQPRASGMKHDERVKAPHDPKEFIRLLEAHGFSVEAGRTHYKISHPNRPGVSTPLPVSPSDHRWSDNQVQQVRAIYGIDLREEPR